MDLDFFDRTLSVVDIVVCLIDFAFLAYLIRLERSRRERPKSYSKFAYYRKGKTRRNRR